VLSKLESVCFDLGDWTSRDQQVRSHPGKHVTCAFDGVMDRVDKLSSTQLLDDVLIEVDVDDLVRHRQHPKWDLQTAADAMNKMINITTNTRNCMTSSLTRLLVQECKRRRRLATGASLTFVDARSRE
jgi:exo-beta-1,3-glucanase (GH17 family)